MSYDFWDEYDDLYDDPPGRTLGDILQERRDREMDDLDAWLEQDRLEDMIRLEMDLEPYMGSPLPVIKSNLRSYAISEHISTLKYFIVDRRRQKKRGYSKGEAVHFMKRLARRAQRRLGKILVAEAMDQAEEVILIQSTRWMMRGWS